MAIRRIGDFPIRKKLTWMNMLVSGAALLIASAAFLTYELSTLREAMVRGLSLQAQIAGQNCASAILFEDPDSASDTLQAFSAAPNILFAAIYDPSGELFASYRRNASGRFLRPPVLSARQAEMAWYEPQSLAVARPIVFQGKFIGIIYILSDRQEENQRVQRYGFIVAAVLLLSLLVAWLLSSAFQRTTTQPVMQLAETARIVSREKRYSVRAPATGNRDEIGLLVDAFNEMLARIQDRDAALQQAHERLHLALRSSGVGTWNWSAGATTVEWDDYIYPLFGLAPQTTPRQIREILDLVHPRDRERVRNAVLDSLHVDPAHPEASADFEFRILRPNGEIRWLALRGRVFRDSEGHPVRIAGVCWDISERKRAEEDRQKFISLIEQSDALIAMAGLDGKLLYLNRAGLELTGLDAATVETTLLADLYPDEWRSRIMDEILPRIARNEGNWVGEAQMLRRSDRQMVDVLVNLFPVNDPETGHLLCFAAVVRDITERKQLEEQLRQAQKLESVGQLAGGVAHDFGNLLTIISGFAQIIAGEFPPGNQIRESADEITRAASRAGALTRQLLAFGRRQNALEQDIALNDLIRNIEKMLRSLIEANIDLVLSLEPQAGVIRADRGQIEQVIVNLVINARDAMPKGGRLLIQTTRIYLDSEYASAHFGAQPGEYVQLSVTDTGAGMTPEIRNRIFEPFFTTKEPGKGTGLGLSMVYGIVRQSRGAISVYSEPGLGSTFKLFFPAVTGEQEIEELEAEPEPESLCGTETILVAEDEEGLRKYVKLILERHGYRVLTASNGNDAMRVALAHPGPVDLLLTDMVMPESGGAELALRFAALNSAAPVLYMSGYAHRIRAGEELGTSLIQKPFAASALLLRIRRLLDHRPAGKALDN
ncbi:MAG TPA: PAS domain S-box protein [Bryobacteraceae bacterium]|nr:PAS domain S-box protein [Bryobacteraceae bacterium]